jgi:hypothetical protein
MRSAASLCLKQLGEFGLGKHHGLLYAQREASFQEAFKIAILKQRRHGNERRFRIDLPELLKDGDTAEILPEMHLDQNDIKIHFAGFDDPIVRTGKYIKVDLLFPAPEESFVDESVHGIVFEYGYLFLHAHEVSPVQRG